MQGQLSPQDTTTAVKEPAASGLPSSAARDRSSIPARGWLRWCLLSVSLAAIACLTLWIYGLVRYGSITIALLALQGYALAPMPRVQFLPPISGETPVLFTVQNLTADPVTIVGAQSSCVCTALPDLPVTVPARGEASLNVVMSPSERDIGESMHGHVLLFLDVSSPPVTLEVHTSVSPTAKVVAH